MIILWSQNYIVTESLVTLSQDQPSSSLFDIIIYFQLLKKVVIQTTTYKTFQKILYIFCRLL